MSHKPVLVAVIAVLNHGRNAIVGAPIVVLITKIAEASATIQNAIYVEKTRVRHHIYGAKTFVSM